MVWMFPALVAPALWAASNVVDSTLVSRSSASITPLLIATGLLGTLPGLLFAISGNLVALPIANIAFALLTGAVAFAVYFPYLRALQHSHATTVILTWNISPLFVAVLAYVIVGEHLTVTNYSGIALLVLSAIVATLGQIGHSTGIKVSAIWMLVATLLSAIEATMTKAVFHIMPTPSGIAWIGFGGGLAALSLFLLPSVRGAIRAMSWHIAGPAFLLGEFFNIMANLSSEFAISLGPVSLVKAVGGLQPLWIVLFMKKVVRKESPQQTTVNRMLPIALIFAVALSIIGLFLGWRS
jgi:transporter family protein